MSHYILDGYEPRCTDTVTWKKWFDLANGVVARTEVGPDFVVSTVFVGLGPRWYPGRPLLFESEIVESGVFCVDCRRAHYSK